MNIKKSHTPDEHNRAQRNPGVHFRRDSQMVRDVSCAGKQQGCRLGRLLTSNILLSSSADQRYEYIQDDL